MALDLDLTRFLHTNRSPPRIKSEGMLRWKTLASNSLYRSLTSNDDASSGGANDGGDASPNACDANGGGANPSGGDASPSAGGPSHDDGRGPSALLPA